MMFLTKRILNFEMHIATIASAEYASNSQSLTRALLLSFRHWSEEFHKCARHIPRIDLRTILL